MSLNIEWDNTSVSVSYVGEISYKKLRDIGEVISSNEKLESIKYITLDFSDADFSKITPENIESIASIDSVITRYKSKLNIAIITHDEWTKNLSEKYIEFSKKYKSPWHKGIFDNYDDASKWASQE